MTPLLMTTTDDTCTDGDGGTAGGHAARRCPAEARRSVELPPRRKAVTPRGRRVVAHLAPPTGD